MVRENLYIFFMDISNVMHSVENARMSKVISLEYCTLMKTNAWNLKMPLQKRRNVDKSHQSLGFHVCLGCVCVELFF